MRLLALTSEDGGTSWKEHALAATSGPSDQPRVLMSAGRFHVFWNTAEIPKRVVALP